MRLRRALAIASAALAVPAGVWISGPARANDACTDHTADGLDPACLPDGTATQFLRQLCSYIWQADVCAATAFADPGWSADADPNPAAPLRLYAGAVHEHSSYSDGDPHMVPADYFRAARSGRNTADAGGDSGVILDFMFSSEHSDNAQIPITTAAACIDPARFPNAIPPAECFHGGESHHYWKWPAALRQAMEATTPEFTAVRGFEWTNDYYNHMNVYFSTNFANVKIDGSYVTMDQFWDWVREPVSEGGGADGLLTFNHPGGDPALTPFDGDQPHNQVLAQFPGGANWNDLEYVPDVDPNVAGMEVNGGDDIEWYVKALTRGWHIGPVAAEDEHEREWSSSAEGKTLVLSRGRTPKDYYFALRHQRTIAVRDPLVGGAPGTRVQVPELHWFADGSDVNDPRATVLGGTVSTPGSHTLRFRARDLPAGARIALVSNTTNGQAGALQLGTANAGGVAHIDVPVTTPASGSNWYFAVVCMPGDGPCGRGQDYAAVTAPIWFSPAA